MDRNNLLYKIRRDMQVAATKCFGYKAMTKFYYRILLKKKCNLENPQDLNDKICWLKVYDYPNNKLVIQCADKFLVREYVKDKIGEEYLVPLVKAYDTAKEIDFSMLPEKFILKCNHGCAYNILVNDKKSIDERATKKQLAKWLKEDFSLFNAEPQYHAIPRKIVCEKHLGNNLVDYKFFCFNGKVNFYYVSEGLLDDRTATMKHYLRDGSVAPFQREGYAEADFPYTNTVKKMIELAEKLAEPFPFVRVDFFLVDECIYFAELTFTPGGGYNELSPSSYLLELGKKLKLPEIG